MTTASSCQKTVRIAFSITELVARQHLLQEVVDELGIGLPLGRLHHLADEEAEDLLLAGPVLGELRRGSSPMTSAIVCGQGALVGDLDEPLLLDDRLRASCRSGTSPR